MSIYSDASVLGLKKYKSPSKNPPWRQGKFLTNIQPLKFDMDSLLKDAEDSKYLPQIAQNERKQKIFTTICLVCVVGFFLGIILIFLSGLIMFNGKNNTLWFAGGAIVMDMVYSSIHDAYSTSGF